MNKYKIANYILLILIAFLSCTKDKTVIRDGSIVAFSLKEAQAILQKEKPGAVPEVFNLGGITRIAGMVIDRANDDIILIGKKLSELPEARFDDLIVALKARLVHNDLPSVSIDPTEETYKTGMQEIRFGGKIENTSFGNDLLECDILLKKYSLDLARQIQNINSYRKLLIDHEISVLREQGVNVKEVNRMDPDSVKFLYGTGLENETNNQVRFWFNYKKPYIVRIRGNVFCLMLLDIVIEKELLNPDSIRYENSPADFLPGDQFAASFSNNYYRICELYPVLNKLKLLYDMTAIAEGLKKTDNTPDISFLLNDYRIDSLETPDKFELIKECTVIKRDDGKTNLIQLSGGIESSVEVEWLNAGDISYLEKIVLNSRPQRNSLYWRIPLDEWKMPNSNGISTVSKSADKKSVNGCYVNASNVLLDENSSIKFNGFSPSQKLLDPVKTKGVQMEMVIDTSAIVFDESLKSVRDKILGK